MIELVDSHGDKWSQVGSKDPGAHVDRMSATVHAKPPSPASRPLPRRPAIQT
jgi:hypothetical protein